MTRRPCVVGPGARPPRRTARQVAHLAAHDRAPPPSIPSMPGRTRTAGARSSGSRPRTPPRPAGCRRARWTHAVVPAGSAHACPSGRARASLSEGARSRARAARRARSPGSPPGARRRGRWRRRAPGPATPRSREDGVGEGLRGGGEGPAVLHARADFLDVLADLFRQWRWRASTARQGLERRRQWTTEAGPSPASAARDGLLRGQPAMGDRGLELRFRARSRANSASRSSRPASRAVASSRRCAAPGTKRATPASAPEIAGLLAQAAGARAEVIRFAADGRSGLLAGHARSFTAASHDPPGRACST